MKRIAAAIQLLALLCHTASGTIRTADSTSRADVGSKYAECFDGDTLVIPAGTSDWTTRLDISKAITIQGTTEAVATISSISVANPAVVTTSGSHSLSTGDGVILSGIVGGTVAAEGPQDLNNVFQVTVLSGTTFSIKMEVTGAPSAGGTVSRLRTIIQDGNATFGQGLISVVLVAGLPTRITAIEFEAGSHTAQKYGSNITASGLDTDGSTLRVDHCKFDGMWQGILWPNTVIGTYDHNALVALGGITGWWGFVKGNAWSGYSNGDGAWDEADQFGTDRFFVLEDNSFYSDAVAHYTLVDAQAGGRYVFRYNYVEKGSVEAHGPETGSRERSGRAYEIYGNKFAGIDTSTYVTYHRGGAGLVHNNKISGYSTAIFELINFKSSAANGSFGPNDGRNPWDVNDAGNPFETATATSAGTLTVTASAETWTLNQWAGYQIRKTSGKATTLSRSGQTVTATCTGHGYVDEEFVSVWNANQYQYNTEIRLRPDSGGTAGAQFAHIVDANTFTYPLGYNVAPTTPATGTIYSTSGVWHSEVLSNDTNEVITFAANSIGDSARDLVFQVGETFELNLVSHGMDMIGRSGGSLVTGDDPALPGGWNDQTTSPWYEWNNTREAGADVDFAATAMIRSGVHYINDTTAPGYTAYTYPHPLTGEVSGTVTLGGAGTVTVGGAGTVTVGQ